MGLSEALLRAGACRPHVLVFTMLGGTAVRLAAEAESRRRGWPAAMTPADADVLLIAGNPVPAIADMLEEVWGAMPAPRARAQAAQPSEVAAVLDAVQAQLADRTGQRALVGAPASMAAREPEPQRRLDGDAAHDDAAGKHVGERQRGSGDGSDTTGEQDHDMGGMDMPAGLPMADRGEDRDGLKLDQLHLTMGPLLPAWPTGLIVHLTVQGDVVQHAEVIAPRPAADAGSFWTEPWRRDAAGEPITVGEAGRRRVAAQLDSLGRFLAVAGWDEPAMTAQRLRDDTLANAPTSRLVPDVHRLTRRVARSRTLQWLTRGVGVLTPDVSVTIGDAASPAVRATGDVTVRYRRWCTDLVDVAALLDDDSPLGASNLEPPRGRLEGAEAPSARLLALLPRLLNGAELAAARLIIASLDPDLDELTVLTPVRPGH